jgi:hypothetical protein
MGSLGTCLQLHAVHRVQRSYVRTYGCTLKVPPIAAQRTTSSNLLAKRRNPPRSIIAMMVLTSLLLLSSASPATTATTPSVSALRSEGTTVGKLVNGDFVRGALANMATRHATSGGSGALPGPPLPPDLTATILMVIQEGGVNTTLLGDIYVNGNAGVMRLTGIQSAEGPNGQTAEGPVTLLVDSKRDTTTVIVQEPTTKKPACVVQQGANMTEDTTAAAIPIGLEYVGLSLSRASLTRSGTTTTLQFVDAWSGTLTALVEQDGAKLTAALYSDVQAVRPPVTKPQTSHSHAPATRRLACALAPLTSPYCSWLQATTAPAMFVVPSGITCQHKLAGDVLPNWAAPLLSMVQTLK